MFTADDQVQSLALVQQAGFPRCADAPVLERTPTKQPTAQPRRQKLRSETTRSSARYLRISKGDIKRRRVWLWTILFAGHQSLDFFRGLWQRFCEPDELPILVHVEHVFNADSEFFFGNINAGFDGEDHARTE